MRSPITGKEMLAVKEPFEMEFKNEKFQIEYQYYLCEDTGEKFEDEHFLQNNLDQVHRKYFEKHGSDPSNIE